MKIIKILDVATSFAENKDVARDIRKTSIEPALVKNQDIILDFDGVDAATQSFIHALISETIREYGSDVLDRISFKNCTDSVKGIIAIVVDYMQA
jgi:hypothetical protein